MDQNNSFKISTSKALLLCLGLLLSVTGLGQELKEGDVIWEFRVNDNESLNASTLDYDNNVYCTSSVNSDGSYTMKLYAVDGSSGLSLWTIPLVDHHIWRYAHINSNNLIYIVDNGRLLALNNETGTELWSRNSSFYSNASIDSDGTVYCSTNSNVIFALDGATGTVEWELNLERYSFPAFQGSMIDQSNIYFYSTGDHPGGDAIIVSIDKETEQMIWHTVNERPRGSSGKHFVLTPSIATNNEIIFYDRILDSLTGEIKREPEPKFGGTLLGKMPITFVNGPSNRIYGAKNTKHSSKKSVGVVVAYVGLYENTIFETYLSKVVTQPPLIGDNGNIYVSTSTPSTFGLVAMDSGSGDIVWEHETAYTKISAPYFSGYYNRPTIGSNGYLYSGLGNQLVAIKTSSNGAADSPWPMLDQNSQRTGRAPAPVADPIQINIPDKTASPFNISFKTEEGSTYEFQASGDLKKWSKLQEVEGTGSEVKITDWRKAIFQHQYYRVTVE